MKFNEINNNNKPYIEICFKDGNIFIPLKVRQVAITGGIKSFYFTISPEKKRDLKYILLIVDSKEKFDIKLYCSTKDKAYLWNNLTIKSLILNRKRETLLLSMVSEGKEVERRSGPRYIIDKDVEVRIQNEIVPGKAKDISYGGLKIEAVKLDEYVVGESINIFFLELNQPTVGIIRRIEYKDFNTVFLGIECDQNMENYFIFKKIIKDIQ